MKKVINAKQFQLNLSEVMHAAAQGEEVIVTYHNKPWVKLVPALPTAKPEPGSKEAFRRALEISFPGVLPEDKNWDELKEGMMRERFGL